MKDCCELLNGLDVFGPFNFCPKAVLRDLAGGKNWFKSTGIGEADEFLIISETRSVNKK